MMKKIAFLSIISFLLARAEAQTDPAAVKILDRFSSTAAAAPSISMKFKLITVNQPEQKSDTAKGSLIMLKDQYKLELPDNITWYNGSASWNLLVNEKEVTVTKPDKKDDSFMGRPSSIFTMYKKGYKVRLISETATSSIVDLYPEDISSDIIRIRLVIGKVASDLVEAEYKRKEGITVYLVVNDYNLKVRQEPSVFTFNPQNYKGYDIIDMR